MDPDLQCCTSKLISSILARPPRARTHQPRGRSPDNYCDERSWVFGKEVPQVQCRRRPGAVLRGKVVPEGEKRQEHTEESSGPRRSRKPSTTRTESCRDRCEQRQPSNDYGDEERS